MARQTRSTEPLETLQGVLTSYEQIEPLLSAAETRGRALVFGWLRSNAESVWTPRDTDLLDLHRDMFSLVFDWAGRTRTDARGPGGIVHVPAHEVRIELRKLADDLQAWVATIGESGEPDLGTLAHVIADTHHRFQWIHPFRDTNGRTGRVVDHGLLWATFALAGETAEAVAAAPVTYGYLLTSQDGNADFITIDNRGIAIGIPCDVAPSFAPCLPIPSGVAALRDLLYALASQESNQGDCTPNGFR